MTPVVKSISTATVTQIQVVLNTKKRQPGRLVGKQQLRAATGYKVVFAAQRLFLMDPVRDYEE